MFLILSCLTSPQVEADERKERGSDQRPNHRQIHGRTTGTSLEAKAAGQIISNQYEIRQPYNTITIYPPHGRLNFSRCHNLLFKFVTFSQGFTSCFYTCFWGQIKAMKRKGPKDWSLYTSLYMFAQIASIYNEELF
jgi:hypothetical protein